QLCGERTLAEDAMQNAFLAAFRGLRGFRGEAQLSTWIYRIAIREALAMRARRLPAAEPPEAAHALASPDAPVDAQVAARQRARGAARAHCIVRARSRSSLRSRSLRASEAAFSNSARASSWRPSFASRSPRTVGSRW